MSKKKGKKKQRRQDYASSHPNPLLPFSTFKHTLLNPTARLHTFVQSHLDELRAIRKFRYVGEDGLIVTIKVKQPKQAVR